MRTGVCELLCPKCQVLLRPTALFIIGGKTYWSAFPEDAELYGRACDYKEHPFGSIITGCRFMRQVLDHLLQASFPDSAPSQEVPRTDDIAVVVPASIADLAASHVHGTAEHHGVISMDSIASPGFYVRRLPAFIDNMHVPITKNATPDAQRSLVQRYEQIRRSVLRDALVSGQGTVVTRGGALLTDSCVELLAHGFVPCGLEETGPGRYRRSQSVSRVIEAPTLLLKRPWWRNYGHWLLDGAALLALLRERMVGGFEQIALGGPEPGKSREIVAETISLLAPGMPVLEHPDAEVWRFTELHYVQPIQIPQLFKLPDALAALRRAILGYEPAVAGHRRLFVSRRHFPGRQLVNEAQVIDLFERYGFEVVFPEELSLLEQARLFASASAVSGVKGAALTNTVFCPPETVVIVMSPIDWPDLFFWDIAGQRHFSYYELKGPLASETNVRGQNPFAIDLTKLEITLQHALSEFGSRR
jgi:capsular polysaccharide biosynthesis protein